MLPEDEGQIESDEGRPGTIQGGNSALEEPLCSQRSRGEKAYVENKTLEK